MALEHRPCSLDADQTPRLRLLVHTPLSLRKSRFRGVHAEYSTYSCTENPVPGVQRAGSLSTWQRQGLDAGSTISGSITTAQIVAQARALLQMPVA
jgi:hypothetical protein